MKTILTCVLTFAIAPLAWAQEGAAERAGKSLDKAAKSIRRGVENAVESVLTGVEQKEIQTRTYYRIHWDQALSAVAFTIDVKPDGAVILRGSVSDAAAKNRAIDLARTTVGVTSVVDELVVGKVKAVKVVPGAPPTPDREIPPVKNTEIKPADVP